MSAASTPITAVLRESRWQLIATYSLFAVEMLVSLLRPYLLGIAVDGLFAGQLQGLFLLAGAHLAYLVIGTARHMFDTRTFSGIYVRFVVRLQLRPAPEEELSRRSALSQLARQVTDFLEYDVNYVVEALYNIVGALALLFLYDPQVVVMCFALLVPVFAVARRYGKSVTRLNRLQFDELERQVDVLDGNDPAEITAHYQRLRAAQVKISDLEAWNFGFTELCVLMAIVGSLWVSTRGASVAMPVGTVIGMYAYVLRFASGLETIPHTIQRLGALREILRRMSAASQA